LGQVGQYLITPADDGFNVNLYAEGDVTFDEENVRFTLKSDFPRCRRADISVTCPQPQQFALRLRVPRWASGATVRINGDKAQVTREGNRLIVTRTWRTGDIVTLTLAGDLRVVCWPQADSEQVALYDGPLCLALSSVDADVEPAWKLLFKNGRPRRNDAGNFQLTDGAKTAWLPLCPIADDWLRCDVKNPSRLRILFGMQESKP
jgi:DUF1680 family protein